MDLIAAPWTDEAVGNAGLIDHLCAGLPAVRISGPEHKPHGRVAVTLQMDGYFKPIDLSIVSRNTDLTTLRTLVGAWAKTHQAVMISMQSWTPGTLLDSDLHAAYRDTEQALLTYRHSLDAAPDATPEGE